MKLIYSTMAIAAGFVGSMCIFAVGAGTAAYFIAIEPHDGPGPAVDVADLWTASPVSVSDPSHSLNRLPPRTRSAFATPAEAADPSVPLQVADAGSADMDSTLSSSEPAPQNDPQIELLAQHVAWCLDHYRSYQPEDDSYTAYSGGRRACISPYTDQIVSWAERSSSDLTAYADDPSSARRANVEARFQHALQEGGADTGALIYASADAGIVLTDDHIRNCYDRYRSYRPEDNSYQPYGGGPRRQCE